MPAALDTNALKKAVASAGLTDCATVAEEGELKGNKLTARVTYGRIRRQVRAGVDAEKPILPIAHSTGKKRIRSELVAANTDKCRRPPHAQPRWSPHLPGTVAAPDRASIAEANSGLLIFPISFLRIDPRC